MKHEHPDTEIASQMEYTLTLLEDHDLVQAEAAMRSLLGQIKLTLPPDVRERDLVSLRQDLRNGIRNAQQDSPFTAVIMFREALRHWLMRQATAQIGALGP